MAILKSLSLVVCFFFAFSFLPPPGLSDAQVIELKASCNQPIQHPLAQGQLHYLKEIETRTNGKVKFNFFHTSTLVKSHQTHQAVRDWVVDCCRSAGIGFIECKQPVIDAVQRELTPIHDRAKHYEENPDHVRNIIADGCEKAQALGRETMRDVRDAMGLNLD